MARGGDQARGLRCQPQRVRVMPVLRTVFASRCSLSLRHTDYGSASVWARVAVSGRLPEEPAASYTTVFAGDLTADLPTVSKFRALLEMPVARSPVVSTDLLIRAYRDLQRLP